MRWQYRPLCTTTTRPRTSDASAASTASVPEPWSRLTSNDAAGNPAAASSRPRMQAASSSNAGSRWQSSTLNRLSLITGSRFTGPGLNNT